MECAVRVKAYHYNRRLSTCLFSVHEYDPLGNNEATNTTDKAGVSSSRNSSGRKKTRRQLFTEEATNASNDGDDLPLAITFGKKKKD